MSDTLLANENNTTLQQGPSSLLPRRRWLRWFKQASWFGALLLAGFLGHRFALLLSTPVGSQLRGKGPNNEQLLADRPLRIDAKDLDLGEHLEGTTFEKTVRISNTSDRTIRITKLSGSCDCAKIEPDRGEIPPGGELAACVTVSIPVREQYGIPDHLPRQIAFMAATSEDADRRPQVWPMTFVVNRALDLQPPLVDWGDVRYQEVGMLRAEVHVKPRLTVADIKATCSANLDVTIRPNGPGYALSVRPKTTPPTGRIKESFTLHLIGSMGEALGSTTVPVVGEIRPALTFEPRLLALGSLSISQFTKQTVRFDNLSEPITDVTIRDSGGEEIRIARRTARELTIEVQASKLGDVSTHVDLLVHTKSGASNVQIPITYYGIKP